MATSQEKIRMVQATTVPETLKCFTEGQLAWLADRGFDITVVSSPSRELEQVGAREGVAHVGLHMNRGIAPAKDLVALWAMVRLLMRIRPHLVQAGTPKAALITLLAAVILRVPARIMLMHGLRFELLRGKRRRLVYFMERLSAACAHRILCVSDSLRHLAVQSRVCPEERIKVLHNGTANGIDSARFDPARFGPHDTSAVRQRLDIPETAPLLLFVGRLVKDKGIIELARAWGILRERYPDAVLVLAGKFGADDPVTEEIIAALASDPRVRMLGQVEDVSPLYAAATLLVHPSYREGFPYVPMEAASMGLPVVATRVTGCVDAVLDGVTGTIVPVRELTPLVQAVERYLESPVLASKHGAAGRERIKKYFRQKDLWEALYSEYMAIVYKSNPFLS